VHGKRAVIFYFTFACLITPSLTRGAPHDPLWEKAVAIASANGDWVAGLTVTRSEVLLKGESANVHEIWQRSQPGERGEIITQTVKVVENGKEVTEKEKPKTKDKITTKKKSSKGGGNPFDPKVQDQLTIKSTDRIKVIGGNHCGAFEFDLQSTNGQRVKGVAWLEKEKGVPMEIENMTIDPLPEKHFKQMMMTTRYELTPEGAWHAKEMITTGTISVMFIRADVRWK
jgi:hypothetical protein